MRSKMTYYFTYEIRGTQTADLKRGGFVFKSASIHPEKFAREVLWPNVVKLDPQYVKAPYRSHEIHEWPDDNVTYEVLEVEDDASDF